jgi:hypothetical protein
VNAHVHDTYRESTANTNNAPDSSGTEHERSFFHVLLVLVSFILFLQFARSYIFTLGIMLWCNDSNQLG